MEVTQWCLHHAAERFHRISLCVHIFIRWVWSPLSYFNGCTRGFGQRARVYRLLGARSLEWGHQCLPAGYPGQLRPADVRQKVSTVCIYSQPFTAPLGLYNTEIPYRCGAVADPSRLLSTYTNSHHTPLLNRPFECLLGHREMGVSHEALLYLLTDSSGFSK